MAHIKSAVKRIKLSYQRNLKAKAFKSSIKTFTKNYIFFIEENKEEFNSTVVLEASKQLSNLFSKIDKSTRLGILSKSKGSRKKSYLSNLLKGL
uniref:Ribosomal protein S20 n=1 Tax=Gloeochaete wittrockiana TaxID=38269 RepID=A0A3G1IVX9_9EUKA|nr:ribosomal protein S20 [Gloeochaete wittrockiana]ASQ40191.1 ribosomal protein S20 [Gloeochaete wittrockiana]